ncbi:hypothetical protein LCGC14_0245270 [marine sediment metagenome]|uniref:Uncharacterized protein n=1 Tax=marine sediment metagenome TaxID=412755 RepID=A0A0F9WQY6_9ZZZZ
MTLAQLTTFVKDINRYLKTFVKPYKTVTMSQTQDVAGNVAYTGFSKLNTALTSEARWAVKKTLEDTTETWAGRYAFDEILDDYLSLSYS